MEPTDFDMDTSLYIVPRRQEGFSQVREHNALLETPWSNTSHALVPIRTSEAIVTTISDESMERAKKGTASKMNKPMQRWKHCQHIKIR